ncbi:HAMP domain-containing sensor histidine kinase [Psychrobacter aestuarii]|uniref:histidine kinase n=1 Tax=Psychrobacter aestuarii TaxID=556327 RepID=A0ABN0VTM7_9GAMM|nr:HAMP domain-containing sensor histidine kinase [Psychrobacter aestuarii]
MQQLGFRSVFAKLFASVMLALILFAVAMVLLTQLVHDKDATIRSEVVATQVLGQVDPFLGELNTAIEDNNRLQARFMLAVIKKSFDIFDESLQAKMGLYDQQGMLLMQTDNSDLPRELPAAPSFLARIFPSFADMPPIPQQAQVYSSTGYTLLYESRLPPKKPVLSAALNLFTGTLLLLIIMAGVLWWIARSMTWRINQMSQQMGQLGDGDFTVRVNSRGNDEIASLARGFNQAAQKIEHLINANNLLLAHASHELRTPITRIRLQVEMMDMLAGNLPTDVKAKFDKRAQAINRDLSGLNDLVESILLVSRLDAGHAMQQIEPIEVYDLINQERQHYSQATFVGEHLTIEGQPPLLTHLIRNLLNNAMLHGTPPVTVLLYGVEEMAEAIETPVYLKPVLQTLIGDCANEATATAAPPISPEVIENWPALYQNGERLDANAYLPTTHPLSSTDNPARLPPPFDDAAMHHDSHWVAEYSGKLKKMMWRAVPEASSDAAKAGIATDKDNKADVKKESLFKKHLKKAKSVRNAPKYMVLAVIDQGSGIPEDKREEIFSPFVRLQQKNKGSGLGLSLVSQIVAAHQGRITTDTLYGHTRFLVVLPVIHDPHYHDHAPKNEANTHRLPTLTAQNSTS